MIQTELEEAGFDPNSLKDLFFSGGNAISRLTNSNAIELCLQ